MNRATRLASIVLVNCSFLVAAASVRGQDDTTLEGTWVVVLAKEKGKDSQRPVGDKVTFAGDKMKIELKAGDQNPPELTIKLDMDQTPHHIDVTFGAGDDARVVKGVFAIKDDQLKICLARPNSTRPSQLESKEGTEEYSLVLKRAAEDAEAE